ncbi:MAG: hypothetical protein DLM57_06205 [Pseudonocardiales bacterium]|nr:MAG: hypothetical protein DLM57_06205 [Pseudonocardiales bacterium]
MDTGVLPARLVARDERPDHVSWRLDVHLVFWGSSLLLAAAAMVRNGLLFTQAQYPSSDAALNSLLVHRAEHFEQLVGNYSRVGFNHPGPVLLYFLAAGQAIFHDLLHVVPAQYNGQELGAIVYVAVFVGLTMVSMYRLTRSRGATAISFGIVFIFAASNHLIGNTWFPYLYIPAFLLFMVTGAAVAAGRTVEVPLFVLSAAVLVHGHVSFLMFVGVTALAVLGGWWHQNRMHWRAEWAAHRRGLQWAMVLICVAALPIAVETVVHYPGQWPLYLHFVEHGQHAPRTGHQILNFLGVYWGRPLGLPTLLGVVAGIVALVLTGTERNRERRPIFVALYGMVLLQSLLMLYYVARGVDQLTRVNVYVGYFYLTVPLLLVATAAAQLWIRVVEGAGDRRLVLPRSMRAPSAALLSAVLVVLGASSVHLDIGSAPHKELPGIVTSLRAQPARGDRMIEFELDDHDTWPAVAGVAAESLRVGLSWCVQPGSDGGWQVLFSRTYTCRSTGRPRWIVHCITGPTPPSGAHVIWSGFVGRTRMTMYDLGPPAI